MDVSDYYRTKILSFSVKIVLFLEIGADKIFGNYFINIDIIVILTSVTQSYQQWMRSQRVRCDWPV